MPSVRNFCREAGNDMSEAAADIAVIVTHLQGAAPNSEAMKAAQVALTYLETSALWLEKCNSLLEAGR